MVTLTVKIPEALAAKLEALVRQRGQSRSAVVREAIEQAVAGSDDVKKGSVLDLIKDLKGVGKGPKDLSTNPKYLRGYGE